MRLRSLAVLPVILGLALALPACGGGEKFRIAAQDIQISSTALPLTLSGQAVNHVIPTTGSCPGPYVMAVISGLLPPGMFLDNATRSIQGVALQEGFYSFRIQIDATGCTPFATTSAQFNWTITTGPVAIVLCDPALIPADANGNSIIDPGDYSPPNTVIYPGVDGLETTVYNAFAVFNFTIAGGLAPYIFDVMDDPGDPDDGALPLGVSIPPFSSSFTGAPQEVKPGGRTFKLTLRAIDANNQVGTRKVQWKIDTPPIVVATTTLANGKCGTPYAESIQVVGGVPPFEFEQTGTAGNNATIVWQSPLAPVINGGAIVVSAVNGRTTAAGLGYPAVGGKVGVGNYPGAATPGPYLSITPEGVVLRETTGSFNGTPRRLGTFTFHIHVFSTLVPNEFGQHAWQTYSNTFANSEPPTVPAPAYSYSGLASWTIEGGAALLGAAPWSTIPEFEVGLPYNPDGGAQGLQMLAQGGVSKDGLIDAPHFTQLANNAAEVAGTYDWTFNWDADSVGAPTPPPGIVPVLSTGVLTVPVPANLQARGRTNISFTTSDQQLPTGNMHIITGRAAYSVGPDKVIITESTTSNANTSMTTAWNDHLMDVKVMRPFASGITVGPLTNADLSGSVTSTGINGYTDISLLATLLDNIDIMRVSVNPTGYWDDTQALNPGGARPGQHGDRNQLYGYYNPRYDNSANGYIPMQPTVSAVALPNATLPVGVLPNTGTGIYKDGGKLYCFQGASNKFGIFIVRRDSTITIPCAFNNFAGNPYRGFGDGAVQFAGAGKNSGLQVAQLTVSPDGRFGAMKLKRSATAGYAGMLENASTTGSAIVVFSLTGEKPFSGAMFKVIETGSAGTTTGGGVYQYANSLCLTNDHLYYLCGNYASTYASWKEHMIYRYSVTGGLGAGAPLGGAFPGRWTNTTGAIANMMQTPFQKYDDPETIVNQIIGFTGSFYTGFSPIYATTITANSEMYMYDGWNSVENGLAPMPFRVSKDGQACAILAGIEPSSTNSAAVMNHDVWVDYQGTLSLLSSTPRHSPGGGGRGYQLAYGPNSYQHWGRYTGPTTRFEISDDASKVAVVVNRQSVAVNALSTTNWYNYRDDIIAYSTTASPKWSTAATQIQVTGTEDATAPVFAGSHLWRFGALVFTKDNTGLLFWGGRNCQTSSVNSTQENQARFAGTLYTYNFGTGLRRSILPTAAGGNNDGIASYNNTSAQVNATNTWAPTTVSSMAAGRIRPFGGFVSKNKDFFYMIAGTPLGTTSQSMHQLVGANIRSLNGAANINGRVDGEAFKVLGQTDRRGWLFGYNYYLGYYMLIERIYTPSGTNGFGYQVVARNTGVVFTGSQYQANGPTLDSNSSTSSFYVGNTIAAYWGDYGQYGGQVEGFVADLGGPVQRLNNTVLTLDTGIRAIHYLECNEDGSAIAFVYDTQGNPRYYSNEVLMYQQVAWNFATGAATLRNPTIHTVASGGRVSESIAHDTSGNRLYYAFSTSGNEAGKVLTEMRFNKSLTAAPDTLTQRSFTSPQRWYNVLHSGR